MELESNIQNAFDGISLLLAFITILFGLRYPDIVSAINEEYPNNKPLELKRKRSKLLQTIVYKWIPVLLSTFICMYVMAPLAMKTIIHSNLNLINFSLVRTVFVLAWYFSLYFFFAALYLTTKAVTKYFSTKPSS